MSEDVQKMFNAIAPRYDQLNHLLSFHVDHFWRQEGIRIVKNKNRVLDLCAGTLDLSIMLAKQSPQVAIDAVDFSSEMLSYGHEKLNSELQKRIHTYCYDVQHLSFQDNCFDGAMVAYGMRNVADNQKALTEVLRVLRPGSPLIILEFFKPTRWTSRFFHATYGRFVLPLLGGFISGNRQAYRYLRDSIQGFYTTADYTSLMSRCGFQNISVTPQWGGVSTLIQGKKP